MKPPKLELFDFKDIVTDMVKSRGLHEGIWQLYVEFGLAAVNMPLEMVPGHGETQGDLLLNPADAKNLLRPVAMIPIRNIGLVQAFEETAISVDAAKVNPKEPSKTARKTPQKK